MKKRLRQIFLIIIAVFAITAIYYLHYIFIPEKIFTLFQSTKTQSNKYIKSSDDPVLLAVGDIGDCNTDNDEKIAKLMEKIPGTIALLGDTVYENGTWEEFMNCFDPAWGKLKSRIKPAVGNHEYHTKNAESYFRYFGKSAGDFGKGYYSYNLGTWHIIALNSQICAVDKNCINSEQIRWLIKDLEKYKSYKCTLAYRHHPRFSSGANSSDVALGPFWEILYKNGVDVILSGHDHDYERFAPQTPQGIKDEIYGIRSFVVGTGGKSLEDFSKNANNSEVRNNLSYGILKLSLGLGKYSWEFLPTEEKTFSDNGEGICHDAPTVH